MCFQISLECEKIRRDEILSSPRPGFTYFASEITVQIVFDLFLLSKTTQNFAESHFWYNRRRLTLFQVQIYSALLLFASLNLLAVILAEMPTTRDGWQRLSLIF